MRSVLQRPANIAVLAESCTIRSCARRHLSAPTARSDEVREPSSARHRPVQARSGAPGGNRTSDTRFRKHEEGVVARSASCAKVLHGPRFCAGQVLRCARLCSAVTRRLVGRMSAMLRPTERRPSALSGATLIGRSSRPWKSLLPRAPQQGEAASGARRRVTLSTHRGDPQPF